ncbi:DUF397 domain-containing protein [Streptomyces sp. NPDC002156]
MEVRLRTAGIDVRDSKNLSGPVVVVGTVAWLSFLAGMERVAVGGL